MRFWEDKNIITITETDYMGFHLEYVENQGWKIVLKDVQYLFPTMQDAQRACRQFHELVQKNKGEKIISF